MKIAIWGTGKYFEKYMDYIPEKQVSCIIDSDIRKQDTYIRGKRILAPEQMDFREITHIFLLVKDSNPMIEWLNEKGIKDEMIVRAEEVERMFARSPLVNCKGKKYPLEQWISGHASKKVFFLSHGMDRSGAPMVLLRMAKLLKENYSVLLAGPGSGALEEELEKEGVDYISDVDMFYRSDIFYDQLKTFDLLVVNTVTMDKWVMDLSKLNKPIIWWLHESDDMYYKDFSAEGIDFDNVYCYAVGRRVQEKIQGYVDSVKIGILTYYLPELSIVDKKDKMVKDKMVFAIIGVIDYRKAHDLLFGALDGMSDTVKNRVQIIIAGAVPFDKKEWFEKKISDYPQVKYVGELSQKEVQELYQQIDILLCPSRDDPMPVVVTQAMQNGIPCIVSDQVGQAEYIAHMQNGFVFGFENVNELSAIMEWCVTNSADLQNIGTESEKIYNRYFSKRQAQDRIQKLVEDCLPSKEV